MILAMNFDFSWFLTIPGMLITGGVLLLVIALIIFIATSSKKDKNKNKNAEMNAVSQSGAQAMVDNSQMVAAPAGTEMTPQTAAIPEMPEMQMNAPMEVPPVMPQPVMTPEQTALEPSMMNPQDPFMANGVVPEVAPMDVSMSVMDTNPILEAAPSMEPLAPTIDVTPPTEAAPYVVSPVQEMAPTMPEVAPVVAPIVDAMPVAEVSQSEITMPQETIPPVMPEVAPVDSQPTIYGGASPVVPEINIENQTHQIYGGANPLENTQTIPAVPPVAEVAPAPVAMPEMVSPTSVESVSMQPEVLPAVEATPIAPMDAVSPAPEVVPTITEVPSSVVPPVMNPVQPEIPSATMVSPEGPSIQPVAPVMEQAPVVPTIESSVAPTAPVLEPEVVSVPPVNSQPAEIIEQTPTVVEPVAPVQVQPIQAGVEATAAPVEIVEIA